jgi:hypothetical protein
MGGEGFLAQAAGGVPLFGGFFRGAINSIHRYAGMYAAAQQQVSRQVGVLGRTGAPGSFGRFGLARPEAIQQAAQFARTAGRAGGRVTPELMNQALEMQMLGGIQEAPGIIRAAEAGGGFTIGTEMTEAVSAGIQMGIRETRLGQFIGVATQVLEQARIEGTGTELQTVLRTFAGFSGLGAGFVGEQGQRAGMQAMGALRRFQPGADVASLVALRSVGFGQPGGPGYHEALEMFQQEPARVLPRLLETIRGMAPGNEAAQIELMRQISPRLLGFTPSIQQARSMVQGNLGAFEQEVGPEGGRQFLARRRGAVGGAFGVPAREAAFRNQQLALGGQVYGASRQLMRTEMGVLVEILPRVADGIQAILEFLQNAWQTFQQEGFAGLFRETLGSALGELLPGLPELPSGQEAATTARNIAVRAAGGAQFLVNETIANAAEMAGASPETVQALRGTAARGLGMMTGGEDVPTAQPAGTAAGAGPVVAPTPEGASSEPEADAAAAVRRARDALDAAAGHLDRLRLPAEGQVAVG